jgi:hypothetical protein
MNRLPPASEEKGLERTSKTTKQISVLRAELNSFTLHPASFLPGIFLLLQSETTRKWICIMKTSMIHEALSLLGSPRPQKAKVASRTRSCPIALLAKFQALLAAVVGRMAAVAT